MTIKFYLITEEPFEENEIIESEFGNYQVFPPNNDWPDCGWYFPDECEQLVGPFDSLEEVYDVASVYEP